MYCTVLYCIDLEERFYLLLYLYHLSLLFRTSKSCGSSFHTDGTSTCTLGQFLPTSAKLFAKRELPAHRPLLAVELILPKLTSLFAIPSSPERTRYGTLSCCDPRNCPPKRISGRGKLLFFQLWVRMTSKMARSPRCSESTTMAFGLGST